MTSNLPLVIVGCPVSRRFVHTIDSSTEDNSPFFEWLNRVNAQTYKNYLTAVYMNDVTDDMYNAALVNTFVNRVQSNRPMDGKRTNRGSMARMSGEMPYQRFAEVRNNLIKWLLEVGGEAKYFMSIDSDVLIHEDAVQRCVKIMEENEDIVMLGIPVNNSRERTEKHPLGLFLGSAQYSFGYSGIFKSDDVAVSGYTSLRGFGNEQMFNVDFLGACMMIRMNILRPPLSIEYGPHRQGEDCFFCHAVKKAGLRMTIDPTQVTMHMMDPGLHDHDYRYFEKGEHI